jgi:hypothetical protein
MAKTTRRPNLTYTFEDVWAALMEHEARQERDAQEWKERKEKDALDLKKWEEKIDRMIEENNKNLGGLNRSFGEMAEHLVAPGIVKRFNEMGYHFTYIVDDYVKILDESGKILAEIDIYLENGDYIIAVEVKSKPAEKDITEHIERLKILRENRDKYNKGQRIIQGAIAGAIFTEKVKEAALKAGLYVFEQSGDTMKMEIPSGFKPRGW